MDYSVSRVQWEYAAPLLKNVRERVFVCEHRIPKTIEFDRKDKNAIHMLVCDDKSQEPVATGRILPTGEISRIAVLSQHREKRLDQIVIQGLIKIAHELGLEEVFIFSPLEAVDYFIKQEFCPVGSVFMEAGLPKQKMTCTLECLSDTKKCYLSH